MVKKRKFITSSQVKSTNRGLTSIGKDLSSIAKASFVFGKGVYGLYKSHKKSSRQVARAKYVPFYKHKTMNLPKYERRRE